jgi:hypothetical protein
MSLTTWALPRASRMPDWAVCREILVSNMAGLV